MPRRLLDHVPYIERNIANQLGDTHRAKRMLGVDAAVCPFICVLSGGLLSSGCKYNWRTVRDFLLQHH
jgi:hypothetical protein